MVISNRFHERLATGPSTEGGWRHTVSNLGQGESFPLAFPPELGRLTHERFINLVVLLCGICLF